MSAEKLRELKTLASVCPELNMANYTEDDVRHLNDWAIEMSLLVEQYALSQQPATPEPVVDVRCEGCGYMTHHREHMGCVRAAKQHTHPAPSVPGDDFDLICNAIDKADTITMEGDYMLDSDDCIAVVRVMQVLLSVRTAMLAAKDASA